MAQSLVDIDQTPAFSANTLVLKWCYTI